MDFLRTPDSRFAALPGYPFAPNYVDVHAAGAPPLRMHSVDEGPRSGSPVVLLHGEPTWSYLYRNMIAPLAVAGHRVLAPDLIGFGRSDKPTRPPDYTYQRHVEWLTSWMRTLDLRDITMVAQDWGSLIGLRVAGEHPDRFAKLVVANGFLPSLTGRPRWRSVCGAQSPGARPYCRPDGWSTAAPSVKSPGPAITGYDAPFPDKTYQAGARPFPQLVPTSASDPAIPANRADWEVLGRWEKPVLCVFGSRDPILGTADRPLIRHIPGAAGQPHARIEAGHFIPEDAGPEPARRLLDWEAGL